MNQSLSVDCAVFGFNGKSLKVLLIERRYYAPTPVSTSSNCRAP
ncbi:MAG: hypothetical protein ACLRMJ_11785 [Alistipes finegoldii]